LTVNRANQFLDSLDLNALCMLALPLMRARYARGKQPIGQLARLNAVRGLTVFLESRLRLARDRINQTLPASSQLKAKMLRALIKSLGRYTRRPWYPTLCNALNGRNRSRVRAQTGAETHAKATAALVSIQRATGPGAGRGRFAARAYLTALLVRNFANHTLEYDWPYLKDGKWQRLVTWVCAAILQCDLDFPHRG